MLRPSQEVKRNKFKTRRKRDSKSARLKCIFGSDAQRRKNVKVTLPTLSFQKDKDQP
jgi:hypothetical protein